MSEQESGEQSGGDDYGGSVVQFRARASAARVSEPLLSDEERLAVRRLIGMEQRILLALRKLDHLEHACPTAKREIRALLLDE